MSLTPTQLTLRHLRDVEGWPLVEVVEMLLDRVHIDTDGCWVWTGAVCKQTGYGRCSFKTYGERWVHRLFYLARHGTPVPAGMVTDHLCRKRPCCNPDHLEAVTASENSRRSPLIGSVYKSRSLATHCVHGHPRTPDNLYIDARGNTSCETCRRIRRQGGQPSWQ